MDCFVYLIIGGVAGAICAAIASSKGRSVAGWFFVGFLCGLIGIIIVACMSNLNEEKARFAKIEQDRRRLREQLRQEQIKSEAFRLHAAQRLDAHDKTLGMDTRQTTALLTGPGQEPHALPGSPEEALAAMAQKEKSPLAAAAASGAVPPVQATEAPIWFYENAGRTFGPVAESQILAMIRQNSIHNHTLLWRQGMDDWAPADQVAEFSWAVQT